MAKKKILIIEDDADLVRMVKTRLEANGYDVIGATNGDDGLEKAKTEKPDLILLDIKMPRMDGYTTLKGIRGVDEAKTTPVIVVTAYEKLRDLFGLEGVIAGDGSAGGNIESFGGFAGTWTANITGLNGAAAKALPVSRAGGEIYQPVRGERQPLSIRIHQRVKWRTGYAHD